MDMEIEHDVKGVSCDVSAKPFTVYNLLSFQLEVLMRISVTKHTIHSLIRIEEELVHSSNGFFELWCDIFNLEVQNLSSQNFTVGDLLVLQFVEDHISNWEDIDETIKQMRVHIVVISESLVEIFLFSAMRPVGIDSKLIFFLTAGLLYSWTHI